LLQPFLFRVDKAPKFVQFDVLSSDAPHFVVKDSTASFANGKQQGHNSVLVSANDPGNGADAHAFDHHLDDLCGFVQAEKVVCYFGATGAKRRAAMMAAVTLDSSLTIGPEFLDCRVMAFKASHGRSPLDFSRGKRHNGFVGPCAANPAHGSGPALDSRRRRGFLPNYSFGGSLGFIQNLLSLRFSLVPAGPFAFAANCSGLLQYRVRETPSCSVASKGSPFVQAVSRESPDALPEKRGLPIFCCGFDIFSLRKAFQNRVNRCERIRISSQVKTISGKSIFDFYRSHCGRTTFHSGSDCIGESRRLDDFLKSFKVAYEFALVIYQGQESSDSSLVPVHFNLSFLPFFGGMAKFLELRFNHFLVGVH
jgi:hypothetical protein